MGARKEREQARAVDRPRAGKLASARILIADDAEANRQLLELALLKAGASVQTAKDGCEALDYALSQPFDLILTDIHMPVMDGYTAVTKMRAGGLRVPIIALTANADGECRRLCREAGCSRFLHKPIEFDRLIDIIFEALVESGWRPRQMQEVDRIGGQRVDDSAGRTGSTASDAVTAHAGCEQRFGSVQQPGAVMSQPVQGAAFDLQEPSIESSLPLDDPEFAEIVLEFVDRLHERVAKMRSAWAAGDFEQLTDLAHWLKGCAGTLGFDQFTQPALQLERAARGRQAGQVEPNLTEIERLAARVRVRVPAGSQDAA